MPWGTPAQPLVDASFLAIGLLRGPGLWQQLPEKTRKQAVTALLKTRAIKPYPSNWLLFSAAIEAFFLSVGEPYDAMRIDYALRQHEQWYRGDGTVGDGPDFHWDYHSSFVIQPYLTDVPLGLGPEAALWADPRLSGRPAGSGAAMTPALTMPCTWNRPQPDRGLKAPF